MSGINCIAALKALGEETRLRILRLLFKQPMSVNEIAEKLDVSQYNISKHLRIMREAGLLELEKQGKQRLYSVVDDLKTQVAANNNILDLGCCTFRLDRPRPRSSRGAVGSAPEDTLRAPMPAQVRAVQVNEGDTVEAGQTLGLLIRLVHRGHIGATRVPLTE